MRIEIDHARNRRFGNHHVVERFPVGYGFLGVQKFGMEQLALPDTVLSAEGALEIGVDLIHDDGREKAQATKIHGEQRHFARTYHASRRKQRAIATQHDNQIRAFGNLLARHAVASARIRGGFIVVTGRNAALREPREQLGNQLGSSRNAWLRNDTDGLNDGHRGGTHGCLPHRLWDSP